ncbi:hypothetical protein HAX54_033152 [Datura stramonium]|uniref:Uncharacterized protein n=1 Tax=Datura stramonium TaxID=4076 RepID=A0ABS8VFL9_DATST|nr:hypothetical protein [Datura stramonium]
MHYVMAVEKLAFCGKEGLPHSLYFLLPYFLLALLFGGLSLSAFSSGVSTSNSSSTRLISGDCNVKQKNLERWFFPQEKSTVGIDERVSLLYSSWGNLVTQSANGRNHA